MNARQIVRRETQQHAGAPRSQKQSSRPSGERKQNAFNQQLSRHPPTARAERQPQGDLLPARCRPRQRQVRYVGASDQHHERHCAQQHKQPFARRADVIFEQRRNADLPASRLVVARILIGELRRQMIHFGLRRRQTNGLCQSTDHFDAATAAPLLIVLIRRKPERLPQLSPPKKREPLRHNPNDDVIASVDDDLLSHNIRIRAEAPAPQLIAYQHHVVVAVLRLFG